MFSGINRSEGILALKMFILLEFMKTNSAWDRFKNHYLEIQELGFSLDLSRIDFPEGFLLSQQLKLSQAISHIKELESGAIANPDENRMVGHYWLRAPEIAPNPEIKKQIEETLIKTKNFANQILTGQIRNGANINFKYTLIVGIGGSALGPQFVNQALGSADEALKIFFFDNTDPDGMLRVLNSIPELSQCLTVVISKSGGTKETRNGMLIAEAAYKAKGLNFADHACAITGDASELDKYAVSNKWMQRLPMFDWIGGRTSELSAVGLLPAALQGVDIDALLKGAAEMDEFTRKEEYKDNPALQLALAWLSVTAGKGQKDMVILPYNDRLELFSRYLQQLVMESLGKEKDLNGNIVNQGIAVYGNKGSTDQHAYIQQLRDGINNFFAVFIRVLSNTAPGQKNALGFDPVAFEVEAGVTSGDYLSGFYQGTREALYQNGRQSITLSIAKVDAHSIGMLIALFERAVSIYAHMVGVNAYHQPGVEAGKKAATEVLKQQQLLLQFLSEHKGQLFSVEQIAESINPTQVESIFLILQHLAANNRISKKTETNSLNALYGI
jgi:glucose-6-phosphate isomerase